MKSEFLEQTRERVKQQLLDALMTLVRENGVDYNDYYRNEHGIEEDDGYTVVKVFDIACFGCCIGLPLKWCVEIEDDADPTPEQLSDEYGYHAYWSLYIERDSTGCGPESVHRRPYGRGDGGHHQPLLLRSYG